MKKATVRQLRHDFGSVIQWVEDGEEVELTKHGKVIAMIRPPEPAKAANMKRTDFAARLKHIYGSKVLPKTGADIVAEDRGRY